MTPGLRKLPPSRNVNAEKEAENANLIARLYRIFIEGETRRRFQHPQFNRKQPIAFDTHPFELPWSSPPVQEVAVPGFTYQFPIEKMNLASSGGSDATIPFAVSPNDPRFYESTETDQDQQQMAFDYGKDYQTMIGGISGANYGVAINNVDRTPSVNIKAPMAVHPKVGGSNGRRVDTSESAIINNGQYLQRSDVIKKHLDLNTVDIYVVAVIAGVSATLTVGLIAIGIAWYT